MTDRREDPSCQSIDAIAAACQTDLVNGLSAAEAARRLAADGPNELRSAPRRATWRRILGQFNDPLTREKMQYLLDELRRTSHSTVCPHGRPVVLRLTRREIERTFERI